MIRVLVFLSFLHTPLALQAQPKSEVQAIIAHFEPLQRLSFEYDREYCGYIGWDPDGNLTFSPPILGGKDSCTPVLPPQNVTVFASYHTHGAFGLDVPAEFPTILDMESDEEEGIDGYIATPGGRLWYVDTLVMEVVQICNTGCVLQDPNFRPGLDGEIQERYTYGELLELEKGL